MLGGSASEEVGKRRVRRRRKEEDRFSRREFLPALHSFLPSLLALASRSTPLLLGNGRVAPPLPPHGWPMRGHAPSALP